VDSAPLVIEPYRAIDTSHGVHAWRQAYAHAQPWQSDDIPQGPQVTVQIWGMSHARPWEESSELLHTMYTTPNVGGTAFITRFIVARDLASTLIPSVRPSVLPQVTETVGVRLTARLADRPEFVVQRSRSRSPDGAVRSPRLRHLLDIAIPGTSWYTSRAQSPPPALPPSPISNISQYL